MRPSSSYCPNCNRSLAAIDLVPLFSFLFLGRKCRQCKQPISWRYFNVELLTGLLFAGITARFWQSGADCVALLLFTAVLIPIYFIDLATFTIPESLNVLIFAIPLVRDVWGILQKEPSHAPVWGWLPYSLVGAFWGILIFGVIRLIGWLWKRQEAMGLGDVLLARGMGAMLICFIPSQGGLAGILTVWFLLAIGAGAIVGPLMLLLRGRAAAKNAENEVEEPESSKNVEEYPESDSNLGEQLLVIGYCFLLGDVWDYLMTIRKRWSEETAPVQESFTLAPSAVPFGPFMVLGFLLAVFVGGVLISSYLGYALPKT
jgi:leader peptidase (prepilin peptidase)/N-methyltransferase